MRWKIFYRRWLYPSISLLVALSICLTTALPSEASSLWRVILQGAQIIQLSNISQREEINIGKQINRQLLRSEVKLYKNRQINRYFRSIGNRLAAKSECSSLPFVFQVVQDKNINAFATAGGYVYANTGLLTASDNEAELASVIAHEIGHICGRHLVKQLRQTSVASGVATALGVDRSTLVNLGVELALRRPNSRSHEYDADERGLKTLTSANYAPSGMVSFMQKLLSKSSGSPPSFLSTHPATSSRITRLKSYISSQNYKGNQGLSKSEYRRNIRPLL
ncbi:MAG: M48 family metallopeptidase [Mastigocoleus sp.]